MSQAGVTSAFRSLRHTLAALTTNCREFQHAWQSAERSAHLDRSLAGRWEGEWVSDENGHHGALRCAMAEVDKTRYRASFHARYSSVLRVCYCVELRVMRSENPVRLKGQADLGRLAGGIYEYDGECDGHEMLCSYRCAYDHGSFQLKRSDAIRFSAG